MAKTGLAKYFNRLYRYVLCALLLIVISLTFAPVSARMDAEKEAKKADKAAARVLRHMEKMQEKCPAIGGKKKQVEEELYNGTVTPRGSCSHCHEEGPGNGPKLKIR